MGELDLKQVKRVHFIGIGGIGVSALARMMLKKGKLVSGSDCADSGLIHEMKKEGAEIFIGHAKEHLPRNTDMVVYSTAVPADNPELLAARELNLTILTRSEFLGLISRDYYTVAISGTHGKTTTTAMLAKVMIDAGLCPTALIGSVMSEQKTNYIAGRSKYFIVEACEYRRSFLDLFPKMIIVTNVEEDHMDYYKDIVDIQNAFGDFVAKIPKDGVFICKRTDSALRPVVARARCEIVDYSRVSTAGLVLSVPGKHNIENAKAVMAAAQYFGIPREKTMVSLNSYQGTWRRFEYKGCIKGSGAFVYDDYAHHPTEIKATLSGAREKFGGRTKIIAVFQPHLYSRTKDLFEDFSRSFGMADKVIITDIYAAREKDDNTVHSRDLAKAAGRHHQNVLYIPSQDRIAEHLRRNTSRGDVVVIMGAGDIYRICDNLVNG
jgi:UDP-N-acetylmuramate--alanine ligase